MSVARQGSPKDQEPLPSGFEIEFVDRLGALVRGPLTRHWHHRFEQCAPVRRFPSYRGQTNHPGDRWSASTGHLVGFESWLERDNAMLLDFDRSITAYSSQPFWLHWRQGPSWRKHAPDFFARLDDGRGLVVDVREDHRIKPPDAEAFAATEAACATVGWLFRRVGVSATVFTENVRWLAGYRRPLYMDQAIAAMAMEVFARPRALFAGASAMAGDRRRILPVLYHLMWRHELTADLQSAVLGPELRVWTAETPCP